MLRHFILLSLLCLAVCKHGKDSSYCSEPTAPVGIQQKSKPAVPSQFSSHIQCVIMNKNFTTDIHEYFDQLGNRGAVKQLDSGLELDAWYSYNTNEFIAYYVPTGTCIVQQLSTSDQRFLFGYTPQGATGKIFSAAQMLHLSGQGVVEVYMGKSSVRGIMVDTWKSCQYWDAYDATMTVTWYFSSVNGTDWGTAVGVSVPVAARVTGKAYDTDTNFHMFDHWYEFFHFRPSISDSKVFETPAGVQCPGRKNTKPLPAMPNYFSFMSENVDKLRKTVSFMKEYYSFYEKTVMYTYRPLVSQNSPYGTADLMEVHDFNTGVAYITDVTHGNCTATRIENTFDDRQVDKNHVAMRTSQEFFYFDQIQYTYEGVKTVRNIDCDSWIGIRPNWPQQGYNSTWQWFFASDNWVEVNTGTPQGGTPVQLVVDSPAVGYHYEFNIFNFASNEPDVLKFDISKCYIQANRRRFQIQFPGNFKSAVYGNLEVFKLYILKSISQYLKVSPLRVSNLNVYYSETDIIVVFTLLDVAPLVGNVRNPIGETPLATAATTLINLVKSNQLAISLDPVVFPNLPAMVAKSQSLQETTYLENNNAQAQPPSGYKPGAMAGVGVSLTLVGGVLGGGFGYFFSK